MDSTKRPLRRPAAALLCAVTVFASLPAAAAGEVYADDSAVKTASGTMSSIPGEKEYLAARQELRDKEEAFEEARDKYTEAKSDLTRAKSAWESARKDMAGLDSFYDNAVEDAKAEEASAKKAADSAAQTLTEKQNAYDAAKKSAEAAASAYSTAISGTSDAAAAAQSQVVSSFSPSEEGGVIYSAHAAYVKAKNSASGNDRTLEKIIVAKSELDENRGFLGSVDAAYGTDPDGLITDRESQGRYITNGSSLASGAWKNLYNAQQEYLSAKKAESAVDTSVKRSKYDSSMTIDGYLSSCAKTVAVYEAAVSEKEKTVDAEKAKLVKVSGLYVRTSRTKDFEIEEAGLSVSQFSSPVASSEAEYEFTAAPKQLTADGNSAVSGTAATRKIGKSSDRIAGSAPADTDSWYAVYNYESDRLAELVAGDSSLSELLSDRNSTASALADAKAELDSAAADDETAKQKYAAAQEKCDELEAEHTKARAITSDEMKALSEKGTVPAALTEVQKLKTAYEKAEAEVSSTQGAKRDAFEDYYNAQERFKAIEKEFFKLGISKPNITVRRSKSGRVIRVSWKKSLKATRYRVQIRRSGKSYSTYYVTGTSKTFRRLRPGKTYYVRVKAMNKYESSKYTYSGAVRPGKTIRR